MANEAYRYDAADAAAWLQTKFAPAVQGYWAEQLILAQAATDYSGLIQPHAAVITLPLIPLKSGVTKTSGTPLSYEAESTDLGAATITLSTQKALSYMIEDIVQMQVSVDMFSAFVAAAGDSLTIALDTDLATAIQGQTTLTAINPSTDGTITLLNLLTAQRQLNTVRIKIANCAMGIAPAAFELSVVDWGTSWTSADITGNPAGSMFWNGVEGQVFGAQIFIDGNWTNGAETECATIWHPQALGYASTGVKIVGPVPDPLNIGVGFTVHSIYGISVVNANGVLAIVNVGA